MTKKPEKTENSYKLRANKNYIMVKWPQKVKNISEYY